MNAALNHNLYLVKEHVGIFKAANNYDIYDPETGQIMMECREDHLGIFTKMLRFTDYKRMTPFDVQIRTPEGGQLIRVKRGISIFLSKVEVFDEHDQLIGMFKQKLFSIGGAFTVFDANGKNGRESAKRCSPAPTTMFYKSLIALLRMMSLANSLSQQ